MADAEEAQRAAYVAAATAALASARAAANAVEATEHELARLDGAIATAKAALKARRVLDRAETAVRAATRREDRAAAGMEQFDAQRGS